MQTKYQILYQLGGSSDKYDTLYAAASRQLDDGDKQGMVIIAVEYPADGSYSWGIDRSLTEEEHQQIHDM